MNKSELLNSKDIDGKVEARGCNNLGVKLPLGIHRITNKKCWYCDISKGLKPIKNEDYILEIEQIEKEIIHNIIQRENDELIEESEATAIEESKGYIDSKYKPLEIYKQNTDELVTLDIIKKLEKEGLQRSGSRHNSIFKLARYYRYLNFKQDKCNNMLVEWMDKQYPSRYTTPLEDCYKDIEQTVEYIYAKKIPLVLDKQEVQVDYVEMLELMKLKSKNEKLIAYCMLIHSKRYKQKNEVFYMTFAQMAEASGLVEKTAKNIVKKLEQQNFIDVVSRNVKIRNKDGSFSTLPNKYNVKIEVAASQSKTFKLIHNEDINYKDTFNNCLVYMFDKKQLKEMLPRRHYEEVLTSRQAS